MKINSVCLSRTGFVIGGNFRQYILIAGLQLSIPRVIDLSIYRLSSVDVRVASIVNHLSISSSLFFTAMSTLATGRRLLPGVAVGRRNFAAAVCDTCRHHSPCPVAGTRLLVATWCHLSPVFVIIDEGCDSCHASTSWTSVLSSLCYWFE